MGPAIRDARAGDLAAITALYGREVMHGTATFETAPPDVEEMTRRFAAVSRHGLPWLVAEVDGAFAGYAYASPFRPRPAYRYGVEGSIYVEETARGRGVGRALLETLIARIRAMGLRHIIAAISDSGSSHASVALHSALGFRDVGVYREVGYKFDRWLDVTLMQLDLDPASKAPTGQGLELGGGLA